MILAPATLRRDCAPSGSGHSPWLRRLPGAIAALTLLGAAAASHAEALAIELPSMRTPIEMVPSTTPASTVHAAEHGTSIAAPAQAQPERALTRQEVRETLKRARAANIVSPTHDLGDTPDVLAAREAYYALQTEALVAQYAAEQREQELRAALDSELQQRQSQLDQTVAERAAESGADADIALAEPTGENERTAVSSPTAWAPPTREVDLAEEGHTTAMREHELEVTPDTTVAEVMSHLEEVGQADSSVTLTVAEAGEADEAD